MAKKIEPTAHAINFTRFWQELGPNTYPMDLDKLVRGTIMTDDFSDALKIDKQPFKSFEGALVRTNGKREWTMLLSTDVSNSRRQRFTFAHELGHFICHRELSNRFEDGDETLNDFSDSIESEANTFASWLLMPANLIRSEFGTAPWDTDVLREIGNRFECSLQASALRSVQLSAKPIAFVVSRDGRVLWATKSDSAPFMTSFCFGDDLPAGSHALKYFEKGDNCTKRQPIGPVWHDDRHAFESQYFDQSGQGYQYTCIEFQ